MSEPIILETKYSVRYDIPPQPEDSEELVTSVESAMLVAHVMYKHFGRDCSLSVDIGVIATKSTDPSTGLVTEVVDKGLKLTAEDLKNKVVEAVNAKIESDDNSEKYDSIVSSFLSAAKDKFTVIHRYSNPGLNWGDPMNRFDF